MTVTTIMASWDFPRRTFFVVLSLIGGLSFMLFLALKPDPSDGMMRADREEHKILFSVCVPLLIWELVRLLRKWRVYDRSPMRLTPTGLFDPAAAHNEIPWTKITTLKAAAFKRGDRLSYDVHPDQLERMRFTPWSWRSFLRLSGDRPNVRYVIPYEMLHISPQDFWRALHDYARAHNPDVVIETNF